MRSKDSAQQIGVTGTAWIGGLRNQRVTSSDSNYPGVRSKAGRTAPPSFFWILSFSLSLPLPPLSSLTLSTPSLSFPSETQLGSGKLLCVGNPHQPQVPVSCIQYELFENCPPSHSQPEVSVACSSPFILNPESSSSKECSQVPSQSLFHIHFLSLWHYNS